MTNDDDVTTNNDAGDWLNIMECCGLCCAHSALDREARAEL